MLSGLIGSILGFGSSVVPAITEHYKSKRTMEFELKKMEKMAELQMKGYDHEIKRFQEMGLHEEQKALLAHDTAISQGTGFMSALQKSVKAGDHVCFFHTVHHNRNYIITRSSQRRYVTNASIEHPMG